MRWGRGARAAAPPRASGAEPFAAPSMVVGVAGGRFQLAPDDGGRFALCGTAVSATAFRPVS